MDKDGCGTAGGIVTGSYGEDQRFCRPVPRLYFWAGRKRKPCPRGLFLLPLNFLLHLVAGNPRRWLSTEFEGGDLGAKLPSNYQTKKNYRFFK